MKQKKIACFFAILIVLIISQSIFAQEQGSKKNSSGKSGSGLVYQCEHDPGVIANNPGKCSKCGAQLKALTMDEAIENLSGKNKKKPELKLRKVYSVKSEEAETLDSSESAEKTIEENSADSMEETKDTLKNSVKEKQSKEHEALVLAADINKDGFVYQCPECPDQMADRLKDCEECFTLMVRVTVEEAKKNVPVYDR